MLFDPDILFPADPLKVRNFQEQPVASYREHVGGIRAIGVYLAYIRQCVCFNNAYRTGIDIYLRLSIPYTGNSFITCEYGIGQSCLSIQNMNCIFQYVRKKIIGFYVFVSHNKKA